MGGLPLPLPYCSIRVQYSGAPGTALAQVSSVESKSDLVIDGPLANELDGWRGSGANPGISIAKPIPLCFSPIWAMTLHASRFRCTLAVWITDPTQLKLNPHETRAIDLRKLRDAQTPDFLGNKIPAGATDGSVVWIRVDNVPVAGRVVMAQRHKAMASSYECGICSCPANYLEFQNAPDNFTLLLNGNLAFLGTGHYADCNYNNYYYDLTQSAAWSSSNSGVVRPHTGRQWQADGVGAGSANFTGAYTGLVYLGTYCAPSQHPGQDSSPGNVCNGFTITNPVASQVFSMGGATYNSATVPLTTSSTCSGTANWTLSYSYTSRQPATYTGSSSTSR